MSNQKPDLTEIQNIIRYLHDYPQFQKLDDRTQTILAIALAEKDLLGIIKKLVSEDMVGLVLTGLLSNNEFVASALIWTFGLPFVVPNSGEPAKISEPSTASADSKPPQDVMQALRPLKNCSVKLFVDDLLKRSTPVTYASSWVN
jgi:hypothetical protein